MPLEGKLSPTPASCRLALGDAACVGELLSVVQEQLQVGAHVVQRGVISFAANLLDWLLKTAEG